MATAEVAAPGNPGARRGRPVGHRISWLMLVVSTLAIFITLVDRAILPSVLPAIRDEFSLSASGVEGLLFWNGIGTAVGAFVLGAFGDSLGKGPRRAWTWAVTVAIAITASVATVFNSTLTQLKVWRVVMGIGTGGMEPVNVALVSDWWQKEDRGFALGVHQTGAPFGQLFGPFLIAAAVALAGWRAAFLVIPAIGVLIMLGQFRLARRRNLVAVNAFIRDHAMTPSVEEDEPVRFVNPLRSVGTALRDRNTQLGVVVAFLLILCEFGVGNYLTTQLTDQAIGLSLGTAITISGASGVTGWIGQIVWGGLSDRIGRKRSLTIVVLGWVVTLAALTLISGELSAVLLLVFWGVFRNSPFPVLYALVVDSLPEVASAGMGVMVGVAVGLGQVFSALISSPIIAAYGYDANYLVMAGIAALGLLPVVFMRETVVRAEHPGVPS